MVRIPVIGLGVLAPGATGVAAFRELLESGTTAISNVDRFDLGGLGASRAGLIRDFKGKEFIAPMKMRRMNMLSRYAVAAAKMAIDDSGVSLPQATGLAAGTAFGPVQTSVEYMQEYVERGPALAPPQLFAESVANAPGSHIAIEYDLRGFNLTFTQRESSTLAAAMYGASQIAKGATGAAMIGGVDEVNEMLFSVLDRVGALANARKGAAGEAGPFDRERNGLVIGEGSGFMVASTQPATKTYGYFAGFGMARDLTATVSDWGTDPRALVNAMRGAIADADVTIDEIDAVYASANGSRRGDAVEAAALRELFGAALPPVVATKGYFGEYAGGGALQLIAAFLALHSGVLHASPGFVHEDPQLRIVPVTALTRRPLRNVLVNSVSAGGGVVCTVLSSEAE